MAVWRNAMLSPKCQSVIFRHLSATSATLVAKNQLSKVTYSNKNTHSGCFAKYFRKKSAYSQIFLNGTVFIGK